MTTRSHTSSRTGTSPGVLGPFELVEPLGRGAMGEVWRGRHRQEGVEVALKIVTAGGTASSLYHAGFRREVQAMAGLAHPNIVTVLDHGRVERSVSGTLHTLPEHAPWVALELAHASLADVQIDDWPALRFVLRHILRGLAHAHAHGIVHRDLKPANVLLVDAAEQGVALRPVLADFGIAHALDTETRGLVRPAFLGTPWFAPPEQIAGTWRDQGPWTDLYALGCMAWLLCTDAPPFPGPDLETTVARHLAAPLPALAPRFALPTGFGSWLERALAKLPAQRFRHAADAAWCLEQLDDLGERLEECTLRLGDDGVLRVRAESTRAARPAPDHARTIVGRLPEAPHAPVDLPVPWFAAVPHTATPPLDALPFRESWRDVDGQPRSSGFNNVGLGLFDLRSVPFVNRDHERDLLWDALRRVHQRRRPVAVVVRGATGAGTSRLAEWTGRRAAELGLATLLRASHSPTGGPASGLPATLARHFACTGLRRPQLFRRLESLFEQLRPDSSSPRRHDPAPSARDATRVGEPGIVTRWEAAAFAELLLPRRPNERQTEGDEVPRVRISSQSEWQFIVARVLRRVCLRRPAIVWLDDAHWGFESLALVETILEDERFAELPVLFVLTVRDDELAGRPREAARLVDLLGREDVSQLVLRPLSAEHHAELVAQLLPMAPALREHVELRTAGNPLFALQLVGEWVEQGALVPGPEGFELRGEVRATVPNSIYELWRVRVERVVERVAPAQRPAAHCALELAATLGAVVGLQEWFAVCTLAGLQIPHGLLDTLVASSLALREHHAWRFVHVMLQESLLRAAEDAQRLREHHVHCAEALRQLYGDDSGPVAERRSHHLVAAGRPREALAPLAEAIRFRLRVDDFPAAEQLLERREQLASAVGVVAPASPVLVGFTLRTELDRRRGALEQAVAWANRAVELHVGRDDLDAVLVRNALGGAALAAGDLLTAARAFGEGAEIAERLVSDTTAADRDTAVTGRHSSPSEALAEALHGQARVLVREGELTRTEALAERARSLFRTLGDLFQHGWCSVLLASVASLRDDAGGAERHIHEAWSAFEEVGSRAGVAACTNMLAELERARGELEEAEWLYRRAAADWRAIGAWDYATALLNVALVKLHQRDLVEARNLVTRIEEPAVRRGDRFVTALCKLARLATLGADEDADVDPLLGAVHEFLSETRFVERDIAFLLELATDRLAVLGRRSDAVASCRLAQRQWQELDDEAEASRLEARLAELSSPVPDTVRIPLAAKP